MNTRTLFSAIYNFKTLLQSPAQYRVIIRAEYNVEITVNICLPKRFITNELILIKSYLYSIDKLLHSLGWNNGYILPERKYPNPIDITLIYAQKVS